MQITSDLLNRAGHAVSSPGPRLDPATASLPDPFSGLVEQAVTTLAQLNQDASSSVRGLLSGDGTDIHSAMIATEKASLAFDAALAVRNKAVGAYQQIMGMQF